MPHYDLEVSTQIVCSFNLLEKWESLLKLKRLELFNICDRIRRICNLFA